MSIAPIQKIFFGSPGTGKSYKIRKEIAPSLGILPNSCNYIATVFHPEYTYGDFMGKLMPYTNDSGKVEYLFYRGHFLKALAQAYKNIILAEDNQLPQHVLLIIDEINRGNSSAIFGTVFQLLDRETDGWSAYAVNISELEFKGLLKEMSFETENDYNNNGTIKKIHYKFDGEYIHKAEYEQKQAKIFENNAESNLAQARKIQIPPNLSIVATMNTSDNSIYFMDSAFKRRWDWEFVNIKTDDNPIAVLQNRYLMDSSQNRIKWTNFVDNLNTFFIDNHHFVRKIEDKQIGYFFVNTVDANNCIPENAIKNNLMFFVWDNVFNLNKKPLADLLNVTEKELVTFGQFAAKIQIFIEKVSKYTSKSK
jgi:5-methylcytosine-specific restriction enzyme B